MRKLSTLFVVALLVTGAACGASGGSDTKPADKTTITAKGDSTTTSSGGGTTGGGGSASGTESDYTKALTKEFKSGNEAGGDLVFSQKQSECIAPKWVKIIGVDTFKAKDVAPMDLEDTSFNFTKLGLSKAQATDMIDGIADCKVDLYEKLLRVLTNNLNGRQKKCVEATLDRATAKRVLIEALRRDDPSSGLAVELKKLDDACQLTTTTSSGVPASDVSPGSTTSTTTP